MIEDKRKRRTIEASRSETEPPPAPDLMDALQRALDNVRAGRDVRADADAAGTSNGDGNLDELSRDALLERAKKEDIRGRTKMSKNQLADALEKRRD